MSIGNRTFVLGSGADRPEYATSLTPYANGPLAPDRGKILAAIWNGIINISVALAINYFWSDPRCNRDRRSSRIRKGGSKKMTIIITRNFWLADGRRVRRQSARHAIGHDERSQTTSRRPGSQMAAATGAGRYDAARQSDDHYEALQAA